MANNTKKDYTQMHLKASEHPRVFSPHILILNIVMSTLGAIIGLELIVRTGVAPNTSIVGALFAIIISRIPVTFLKSIRVSIVRTLFRHLFQEQPFRQQTVSCFPSVSRSLWEERILCILC